MPVETLVVNAIGGLCNRMRAIATCLHLAELSDRKLKIVWHNNSDLAADYSDLFQAMPEGIRIINPGSIEYKLKWELPRRRNLYMSRLYQTMRFTKTFSDAAGLGSVYDDRAFRDEIVSTHGDILVISGLAIGGFDKEVFRKIFIPSDKVKSLIDTKIQDFDENTIGVHIRRTDNHHSIRQSPLELFITEMTERIEANNKINFFVASDDAEVLHIISEKFGRRVKCGDDKASRSTHEGMLHATADLWALSSTQEILGSYYSSFTDTAALIGGIPLKVLTI